jgi:hypothetical protein
MDIQALIKERALANGVDPDVLLRMGQVESGLNPSAAARASTAKGLFQFTDGTWRSYGGGADPLDPAANADAGARLLRDNAAGLRSAGVEPNAGSLYLAHFAGLGGAKKLLTADPSTPAADVLGDAAVKANPFLGGMTVGDVRGWASGKMGGDAAATATPPASAPSAGAAPQSQTGVSDLAALSLTGGEQQSKPGGTVAALQQLAGVFAPPAAPTPAMPAPALPPPRRVDPQALLATLRTPLLRGSSFESQT